MRALLINAVCGIRSTGRICTDIAKDLEKQGYEVKIAYGRETVPEQYQKYAVRIGNTVDVYWHALMTRLFDDRGYWSRIATKKFLKWADEYDPDLLWLHNLHDYFINIDMLFDWIKSRPQMEVKWTQHDCWAFTGHCAYFTMTKCEQWKTHCMDCPEKTPFPQDSLFNQCKRNFDRKKKTFIGVKNMTLISPSQWLADLIKESFLKEYPVQVVHNTIDTNVFKPTPSGFRKQYGLEDKKIVLGVASPWSKRKGFEDFLKLSHMLSDEYVIVLVGLSEKQMEGLPENIFGIQRTNDAKELAGIYTAADVFVNPTYEDNYPTVNLEAKACGTPVITYDTGGSPESAGIDNSVICKARDIEGLSKGIIMTCNEANRIVGA